MRKSRIAIAAAAVAAICIAGTVAFATDLFREVEDDRVLATLVANLKSGDEPSGWDGGFGGLDECFESLPGVMPDGTLSPELAKFPAKLPGKSFELESLRFGHACGGPGVSRTLLQTNWRHKPTGLSLSIRQSEGNDATERIAPLYASFTDDGYDFWLGADLGGRGGMDSVDPGGRKESLEAALRDLKPPMPLECFYRNELRDWADLAGKGIGDPRPAIPAGYSPIRLEFSVIIPPPNRSDCPPTAPPPPGEPWVMLNAMFSGPGTSLLSMHAASKHPDDTRSASFLPGSAIWFDDLYAYSINWAPEHVTESEARAIAAAMDPKYGAVCSLTATKAPLADIAAFNVREPQPPAESSPGFAGEGPFWTMGSSPACKDVGPTGFLAKWMFEVRNPSGLIEVSALRGQQMPNTEPFYFEDKTIYWKRADGVEFYVSGIKAEFARSTLLAVAASVDPLFDEALISVPPGR